MLNFPAWGIVAMTVYSGACSALILNIIEHSHALFTNFKNDIIFQQSNVATTATVAKFMIAFGIVTLSISTLFISLLLLMLWEIFKNGAALQAEQFLTI